MRYSYINADSLVVVILLPVGGSAGASFTSKYTDESRTSTSHHHLIRRLPRTAICTTVTTSRESRIRLVHHIHLIIKMDYIIYNY